MSVAWTLQPVASLKLKTPSNTPADYSQTHLSDAAVVADHKIISLLSITRYLSLSITIHKIISLLKTVVIKDQQGSTNPIISHLLSKMVPTQASTTFHLGQEA